MSDEYTFSTEGDQLIATHQNDSDKTVSLEQAWMKGDDIEGNWEHVFRILLHGTTDAIHTEAGELRLAYEQAFDHLVASDDDAVAHLDRQEVAALVELLATEYDVFRLNPDSITLLTNIETDDAVSGRVVLKWAILAEECAHNFSQLADTATAVTEYFESQLASEDSDEYPAARAELRETIFRVKDTKDQLDSAQAALEPKASELRTHALAHQQFPQSATHLSDQLIDMFCEGATALDELDEHPSEHNLERLDDFAIGDWATQLAGVASIDAEVEDMSPDDISGVVDDLVAEIDEPTVSGAEPQDGNLTMDPDDTAAIDTDSEHAADTTTKQAPDLPESEYIVGIPVIKPTQPSSKVKLGRSQLDADTDIVKLCHKGHSAYFYADYVSDSVIDDIGNKIKLHENVAELFNGIDRSAEFIIASTPRSEAIEACRSVTIATDETDHDELSSFLQANNYLLHPMEEVVPQGDRLASFEIIDMDPSGYSTLRVTEATDIAFRTD